MTHDNHLCGCLTIAQRWICWKAMPEPRVQAPETTRSSVSRFDDQYSLKMTYINGRTKLIREAEFTRNIAQFFDCNGTLVIDVFELEVSKLHDSLLTEKKVK